MESLAAAVEDVADVVDDGAKYGKQLKLTMKMLKAKLPEVNADIRLYLHIHKHSFIHINTQIQEHTERRCQSSRCC